MSTASFSELASLVRGQFGDGLRALVLFGSCLSPETRGKDSVPDLLGLVDDLDESLRRLGQGRLVRLLGRVLPPIILPFRPLPGGGGAKLNLAEPAVVGRDLLALPDLYLAGRLSKRTAVLYARDERCAAEVQGLLDQAAGAIAGLVLLDLPRRCRTEDAVLLCLGLSYRAELRPEGPAKVRALHRAFAGYYAGRYGPLLQERAAARGLGPAGDLPPDGMIDELLDERPDPVRAADRRVLRRLLVRSRRRFVLRMLRQALVYRGWLSYVVGKLRRVLS